MTTTTSQPGVTAVIPCHNHGQFVADAIDSVLDQNHPVVEVIVIDDASDDPATVDVLARLKRPRTRVVRVPHGHLAAARNRGIRLVQTPYVLVLDSDDRVEPQYLERTVALLEARPDLGVAGSWMRTFGAAEWIIRPQGGGVVDFLHRNNCPGSAVLRRSCWEECGGYTEELGGDYEDWDYYLKVTSKGWEIGIVPEPLMRYYLAEGSLNLQGWSRRLELVEALIRRHAETYRRHVVEAVVGKESIALQRSDALRELLLTEPQLPMPEVTFGDGGMAFAMEVEALRRARNRVER